MAQSYDSISLNIQSITDLNDGRDLQELLQQKSALERHLNRLQELIASLTEMSVAFTAERDKLSRDVQTVANSVSKSLEDANALNNVFGEDGDISTRLDAAQVSSYLIKTHSMYKSVEISIKSLYISLKFGINFGENTRKLCQGPRIYKSNANNSVRSPGSPFYDVKYLTRVSVAPSIE